MSITPRHFRLAAFFGLCWIALECLLFWLAAGAVGVLPVLAFVTLKGFAGFMLFARGLRGIFGNLAANPVRNGLSGLGTAGFNAAGAFLIFLPGFGATLAGLALCAPSVRGAILSWVNREKRRGGRDAIVTLDTKEWREVGVRRKSPAPRARKSTDVAP